jgi:hypothetical protein
MLSIIALKMARDMQSNYKPILATQQLAALLENVTCPVAPSLIETAVSTFHKGFAKKTTL